jgi:hypothetical protein
MAAIREGLAANLSSLPDIQVSPYRLPSPTPPTVQVTGLDEMEPTAMHAGGYTLVFIVQAFVGIPSDQGAQRRLDDFLYPTGPSSIWAALETDRTLSGAVASSAVIRNDGTQLLTVGNTQMLGSSWFVQVEI